ncbi:helix-turn-helix transcriptional regulator [Tropicimonas sp. IMCC6043]|uniref:helix-turn-helix domain-containing protein n=1 Tax=Tropicimonas sp. IMCC6043 TaxID=2510645 RepID=UPI00101C3616|nr:helix-turn-helix transcriptional regulator [Tropicimonas sp. IMCC6043]RYH06120.1 XRE family transcriptional regulator [Tropicimonas sp. IMCC6043]
MAAAIMECEMTGKELAEIRKAAGLSQTALARRVGIGRHAVSYWECKVEVDRRSWAVKRMACILDLPYFLHQYRARTGWGDRLKSEAPSLTALSRSQDEKRKNAESEKAVRRRVRCGAKTRRGTPCRALSEPGKRRCRFHGGMSTGARTSEGIERIREAQRRRWERWRNTRRD